MRTRRVLIVATSLLLGLGLLALVPGAAEATPSCTLQRITNTDDDSIHPTISADGSTLFLTARAPLNPGQPDGITRLYRLRGTTFSTITTNVYQASANRDGEVVAYATTATDDVLARFGSNPVEITDVGQPVIELPSVSDLGVSVAFLSDRNLDGVNNADGNAELFTWSLFGFTQRTTGAGGDVREVAMAGDGLHAAFVTSRNIGGGNADGSDEVYRWTFPSTIEQISDTGNNLRDSFDASISYDGSTIAFASEADLDGTNGNPQGNIFVWREQGDDIEQVTDTTTGGFEGTAVDSTGNRVVFGSTSDVTGSGNQTGFFRLWRWDHFGAAEGDTDVIRPLTPQPAGGGTLNGTLATDRAAARTVFASSAPFAGANSDGEDEVYRATCRTFTDVPPASTFFTDIEWMAAGGISTGFGDGTYRAGGNVTRAAMSAFMYRLAGSPIGPFPDAGFTDVDNSNPFFDEISWMAFEGITTGFPGGLYKPNSPVKRQSMSAFMYRLAGEPAFPDPPTATFSDVPTGSTFFTEIEWMADEGITTGFSGGVYKPNDDVTRAAMSAFMRRLAEGPGVGV